MIMWIFCNIFISQGSISKSFLESINSAANKKINTGLFVIILDKL
jgi:hypothetical protein